MDDRDRPCTFLCARDEEDQPGADDGPVVYLCTRIPNATLQQSSLLRGLASAAGLARLPSQVSAEDLWFWRSSHLDRVPDSNVDLARLLMVADTVADARLHQWADVLGKRAAECSWRGDSGEAMHEVLLSLPENIRVAVLKQMLLHVPSPDALLAVPPTLHTSLVGAMIDSDGRLDGPARALTQRADKLMDLQASRLFIAQLPSLGGPAHNSLRSLRLGGVQLQHSTAHILADALPQQSQLSHLCLGLSSRNLHAQDDVSRQLAPVLRSLPLCTALLDLQLKPAPRALPETWLSQFSPILLELSSLERLTLVEILCGRAAHGESSGASITEAQASAHCWRRFMAAVAAHPALTTLELHVNDAYTPPVWPDVFPRLQAMKLTLCSAAFVYDSPGQCLSASSSYLSKLGHDRSRMHAACPCLTRLELDLQACDLSFSRCLERWVPLGRTSPPCDTMEQLKLEVHYPFDGAHNNSQDIEPAMWPLLEGTVAACPNLMDLDITGDYASASCTVVAAYVPALLQLTRLQLVHGGCTWGAAAWVAFADTLTPLTCLREFHIGVHTYPDTDPEFIVMPRLLRTLAGMPHLSVLHLTKRFETSFSGAKTLPVEARGSVYAEGLRHLTGLQTLHLEGCFIFTEVEQLCDGLAAMPALKTLHLGQLKQVSPAELTAFGGGMARMRSLSQVVIVGKLSCDAAVRLLAPLNENAPSNLRKVTIDVEGHATLDMDRLRLEFEDRGITLICSRGATY